MGNVFTPLQVAEKLLNGSENVAIAAGRHEKAAYQWRYANGSRQAGDFPSSAVVRRVYERLQADGFGVRLEHLIFGATEAELAALLASRPTPAPSPERAA